MHRTTHAIKNAATIRKASITTWQRHGTKRVVPPCFQRVSLSGSENETIGGMLPPRQTPCWNIQQYRGIAISSHTASKLEEDDDATIEELSEISESELSVSDNYSMVVKKKTTADKKKKSKPAAKTSKTESEDSSITTNKKINKPRKHVRRKRKKAAASPQQAPSDAVIQPKLEALFDEIAPLSYLNNIEEEFDFS